MHTSSKKSSKTLATPSKGHYVTKKRQICTQKTQKTRKLRSLTVSSSQFSSQIETKQDKIGSAPLRGTKDYFPDSTFLYRHIETKFQTIMSQYGYNNELRTPILEHRDVFGSTLGKDSDVVMKQMYLFDDSGTPTVLRPENTASVVRSIVKRGVNTSIDTTDLSLEDKIKKQGEKISYPDQFFYCGPMFRRERPQNGRLRQFTQFGIENIGTFHPYDDVQAISMAYDALKSLGIENHAILVINSIGTLDERKAYEVELKHYLKPFSHLLSPDSQARYVNGHILRILDSSDEYDMAIVRAGEYLYKNPAIIDGLNKRHLEYLNQNSEKNDQNNQNDQNDQNIEQASPNPLKNALPCRKTLTSTTPLPPETGAPLLRHSLGESSLSRFNAVLKELHNINIPVQIDDFLIRGLDYYSHTTFEFVVDTTTTEQIANKLSTESYSPQFTPLTKTTKLQTMPTGSYQAVLAGGRYGDIANRFDKYKPNSLALQPLNIGIGWASGLERLILHMDRLGLITPDMIAQGNHLVDIVVVSMGSKRQLTRNNYEYFLKEFNQDDVDGNEIFAKNVDFFQQNCEQFDHQKLGIRPMTGDEMHLQGGILVDGGDKGENHQSLVQNENFEFPPPPPASNNLSWSFKENHSRAMANQMLSYEIINQSNAILKNKNIEKNDKNTENSTQNYSPTLPYSPLEVESVVTSASLLVATKLRRNGNKVLFQPHLTYRQQLAATYGAKFAVMIGEEEVAQNAVLVKNLFHGGQELVPMESIIEYILMDSVFEEQSMQNFIMDQYDLRPGGNNGDGKE
jgi:histidyl-tRNA synthetase